MSNQPSMPSKRRWFERLRYVALRKPRDRNQLFELLNNAKKDQILDTQALDMIEGVIQISDKHVRDIMIPRAQMVTVEQHQSPEIFLPFIIDSGHSRFPVIGDSKDDIIGVLLAKELLKFLTSQNNQHEFDMMQNLRPCLFVPESRRLDSLLREFRLKHNHMAIVVDEYGGVSGLVTIEDILEEIVGNIEDEYDIDDEKPDITPLKNQNFLVLATTNIADFNAYFKTTLKDDDFDTIGGLLLQQVGHMPKIGERITLQGLRFEVKQADNRRLHELLLDLRYHKDHKANRDS